MGTQTASNSEGLKETIGLIVGPLVALVLLFFFDLSPEHPEVTRTAAVALWMAIWWITEAIPIPATALMPVALFPMLGITSGKVVAGAYFNSVIFLFVGGFIVALAMQRWNLHRRVALRIIMAVGASPRRLMLGFMIATAFLSMWISNTATTMMMVPIAMAVIIKLKESGDLETRSGFSVALLLGIAYAASIGGTATLIGTPPNLAFARIFAIQFPDAPEISFTNWMLFALPVAILFLLVCWWILTQVFSRRLRVFSGEIDLFRAEHRRLGPMKYEEKVILILFLLLAVMWVFRTPIEVGAFRIPGWSALLPDAKLVDDGTVAILIALTLFVFPSRTRPGERLMNWETAVKLHWGIVILFGGGFALAAGFQESGLAAWVAERLSALAGVHPVFLVASVSTLLTFLTELTSNTATTQMALPLFGALAVASKINPLLLMIPATLSASCAFMLPVATPPNAIVFGSGEVSMSDMIRAGIILNLVGVVLITGSMFVLGIHVFGIDLSGLPHWAAGP